MSREYSFAYAVLRLIINLSKVPSILGLNKNSKKTRKGQNLIKKIEEIRDTIQDAVLYAKLKKSIRTKS
ncbi:MAG: hypothetical protein WA393_13240 [Nitrososphaeraceae archaeon]